MTGSSATTLALHLYVWQECFLYVGSSKATSLHRNHAAVWLAAPEGKLRLGLADATVLENDVIFLSSGTEYATAESTSSIAALYWEPESESFKSVAQHFDSIPRAFRCQRDDRDAWRILQDPVTTLAQADQLMTYIFGLDLSATAWRVSMDARVHTAIAFLRESPQLYGSIEILSAKVHLSPSRFAHLFKTVVGVPVRRYVLWMKMRRARDLAITGNSLTAAALIAGFSDSAHLSRTVGR